MNLISFNSSYSSGNLLWYLFQELVPRLASESMLIKKAKRDVSRAINYESYENTYSTIALIIICIEIESIRNSRKRNRNRDEDKLSPAEYFSNLFSKNLPLSPKQEFCNLLKEVFVVRDSLVHAHTYLIRLELDSNDTIRSYHHKKTGGGDGKFRSLVFRKTKRTRTLDLNVIPSNVNFEDVFKALVVFDLLRSLLVKANKPVDASQAFMIPYKYNPLRENAITHIRNIRTTLPRILAYYYQKIINQPFKKRFGIF